VICIGWILIVALILALIYVALTFEDYEFEFELCAEVDGVEELCCGTDKISFPCYKLLEEGGIVNPGGDCSGTVAVYYELYGIPPISPKLHIAIYNDLGYKVKDVMSKVPTKLTDTLSISSLPPGDYKAAFLIGKQLEVVPFTVEGIIRSAVVIPNPTNGIGQVSYTLRCPTTSVMRISVNDILGNELLSVYEGIPVSVIGSEPFNISSMPNGAYIVKIVIENEILEIPISINIIKN